MTNILLTCDFNKYHIDFNQIKPENFKEALQVILPKSKDEYNWLIVEAPLTYRALYDSTPHTERLGNIWQLLELMISVRQTPELTAVQKEYSQILSPYFNELSLNHKIYQKSKEFTQTQEFEALSSEKKKLVTDLSIKGAQLQGVDLSGDKKEQLIEINKKLSLAKNQYQTNLQKTRSTLFYQASLEDLKGLSPRQLNKVQNMPEKDGKYSISYSSGIFSDILTYCDNAATRKHVFELTRQIGTQEGLDNRPLAREIVELSHQKAQILGYSTAAHMLMIKNMVKDPQEVLSFLENMADLSAAQYAAENHEYQDFGLSILKRVPELCDRAYVLNKLEEEKYSVNHEEIKKYFPVDKVLSGFFEIFGDLYQIDFKEVNEPAWHRDVKVVMLEDRQTHETLGKCYLDLYMRDFKRTGACCHALVFRNKEYDGTTTTPVTMVLCNSQSESNGPALLSFTELITFFHEMGHGFHGWLSKNDLAAFNGTRNVQRDGVELPSQFMENFCYDYEILKKISSHVDTGETLPYEQYLNILNSKQFLGATQIMRHASLSKADMLMYSIEGSDPMKVEKDVLKQWVNYTTDYDNMAAVPSLHHIFTAGYSAGLYVYKWAEVYSCDAYAALKECGDTLNSQSVMAKKFRTEILEKGGLYDMRENYEKFRGKSVDITHFLKDYAISSKSTKMSP